MSCVGGGMRQFQPMRRRCLATVLALLGLDAREQQVKHLLRPPCTAESRGGFREELDELRNTRLLVRAINLENAEKQPPRLRPGPALDGLFHVDQALANLRLGNGRFQVLPRAFELAEAL